MATLPAPAVPDGSPDTAGVAVATSTAAADAVSRAGILYHPVQCAAAVPVWFHPRPDGTFAAVLRSYWTDGTPGSRPQSYTAHTEVATSGVRILDPVLGGVGPVTALSGAAGDRVVNGAVTLADYCFTIGTVAGRPTVSHYRVTADGVWVCQAEEAVPHGLSLGVFADSDWVRCFGANPDGHLVSARRRWSRLGVSSPADRWQFWNEGHGWTVTAAPAASPLTAPDLMIGTDGRLVPPPSAYPMTPLLDTTGNPIPAHGPVSMARFGDRHLLSTVVSAGGSRTARVYTARTVDRWALAPLSVPLGSGADYLGGGLHFQPQLVVRRDMLINPSGQGFAFVISNRVAVENEQSIQTAWGIFEP